MDPHLSEAPTLFDAPLGRGAALPSYLKGHRKRLQARFVAGGADAMPDYELLELLLFFTLRQGDVKPLARALIERFGDLGRVIAAPPEALREVDGAGDSVVRDLKIVEAAAHRIARARVLHRHALTDWAALVDYCHATMGHRRTEQFRILFLDTKNILIADEAQATGTVDHVPVYPREVVKRALQLEAKALILVHNHPSGDPTPSAADIDMTARIARACETLDLILHDHLIIGESRELSFRASGYL